MNLQKTITNLQKSNNGFFNVNNSFLDIDLFKENLNVYPEIECFGQCHLGLSIKINKKDFNILKSKNRVILFYKMCYVGNGARKGLYSIHIPSNLKFYLEEYYSGLYTGNYFLFKLL